MVLRHPPETGETQHLQAVLKVEIDPAVALALPPQDRVGADGYRAVDHERQVHAQKWQVRVRYRDRSDAG